MEILILLIALVWSARIVFNILTYAQLWWVKEYRWDRMLIHLRTSQGKRFWWPEWRRPPISPKSVLLVLLSVGICGYLVWTLRLPIVFRLAITDLLSFPITWILVLMLNAPTRAYHTLLIALAVRKLRLHKAMTVIGITGSYGKTSVKDYLATILSSKFTVVKTQASKNSPIGIAEVILKDLKPEHDVFVVEMGAYKKGEIAEMANIVRPQIGIVTAINTQHQDLFGSLENTMKAKYELIAGLTGGRIAIMNMDDERVRMMAQWGKRDGRKVWGITKEKLKIKNQKLKIQIKTFFAQDINASFDGVSFTCVSGEEQARVKAQVVGAHQVSNILAAIAGAVAAGMTIGEAAAAAGSIRPAPKVFEVVPGVSGATFINDTFNNNPDAAKAALDVLAWAKGKKFLVFQPMIELGAFAAEAHEFIGAYAAHVCNEIILTNRNFYEDFVKGVRKTSDTVSVSVLSSDKAASGLRSKLRQGDAVLFKGKEAEHVLRALNA